MQKKQAHVLVSGFVQGVGFRRFIRSKARKQNITGWIKNLPDGRVEAVLQGTEEQIQALFPYLHQGPFFSEVKEVVIEWEEGIDEIFEEFVIRQE